ncbi:hypothetical protein F5X98DRAFT_18416 [Xylaria grammica]|nr:hypothetical protein F5X98DRAFT_18416 [Xylaria grammica]
MYSRISFFGFSFPLGLLFWGLMPSLTTHLVETRQTIESFDTPNSFVFFFLVQASSAFSLTALSNQFRYILVY